MTVHDETFKEAVERMVEERLGLVVSALREQVEDIDRNIKRVVDARRFKVGPFNNDQLHDWRRRAEALRAVMRAILDTRTQ